jgi:hypothetical protein
MGMSDARTSSNNDTSDDRDNDTVSTVDDEGETHTANDNENETEELMDTASNTAEPLSLGYTPLDDAMFGNRMVMGMIFPDSMEDDEVGPGTETTVFCCPPNAALPGLEAGDDNDGSENGQREYTPLNSSSCYAADNLQQESIDAALNMENYEYLATSALQQIEDEYRSTLQSNDATAHLPASRVKHESETANNDIEVEKKGTVSLESDDKITKHEPLPEGTDVHSTEDVRGGDNDHQIIGLHEKQHFKLSIAREKTPVADSDRIQKAVQSLRLASPKLTLGLDAGWEDRIKSRINKHERPVTVKGATPQHSIIPSAPLAAFDDKNRSAKASNASAKLSRSATMAEAWSRLNGDSSSWIMSLHNDEVLTIDIIGVDHVECNSIEVLQSYFCPFIRWLDAAIARRQVSSENNTTKNIKSVQMNMVGPNIPAHCKAWPSIDLMPKRSTPLVEAKHGGLEKADARFFPVMYHEFLASAQCNPDFAIAFNAGIWGYNDWIPTIQGMINHSTAIPFVITAYTLEECEDDTEVLQSLAPPSMSNTDNDACAEDSVQHGNDKQTAASIIWHPQENPFKSRIQRDTATAPEGRIYHENGAWQAWMM